MPHLDLGKVKLWYVQDGEGPDIVWIPGGDNVAADWSYQFAHFRRRFRNTSFDPRGAGKTEIGGMTEWSIADMADDCAALIRRACRPPVIVAGISMGGLIALQMAVEHPELTRCVIAMGAAARPTGFSRSWMEAEIAFRRAGGWLTPEFARHHYGVFMYPPEVIDNDELWEKLVPFIGASYGEREGPLLIGQWQACVDFDVTNDLPKCDVPIHLIGFSLDIQAPPNMARRAASLAKNGTFHLLEGLGHLSLIGHKPEIVNRKIESIIDDELLKAK
jgi:pimeloyl-ACP methyl ester carboxylesterase